MFKYSNRWFWSLLLCDCLFSLIAVRLAEIVISDFIDVAYCLSPQITHALLLCYFLCFRFPINIKSNFSNFNFVSTCRSFRLKICLSFSVFLSNVKQLFPFKTIDSILRNHYSFFDLAASTKCRCGKSF